MNTPKIIVFQGDSITDCRRVGGEDIYMGMGYPLLTSSELSVKYPQEYKFLNRGISGNRIVDVYARIKCDIINLKPDYLSFLIGINDVWHELGWQNGVSPDKYFKVYCNMIEEIKEALPEIKIMILEPFVIHGTATDERYDEFKAGQLAMSEKAKMVAEKYNLKFVPLQCVFDKALENASADYWSFDGVHPTFAGHGLIKNEWVRAFEEIK